MIRTSSSFFLSFTVHAVIAFLALATYQQVLKKMPAENENRHCISLSCIVPKKPEPIPKKTIVTPPPVPKKVIRKEPVKPKPEPKVVVKPKPKKQVVVADPEVEKVEPVAVEIVEEKPSPAVVMDEPVVDAPVVQEQPRITPEEEYLQQHLALIAKLLQENLYYPRIARKRGITGEVIVAFQLLQSGEATRIKVNSGDRTILNKAAITTIERLSGDFPKPDEPITLHVPIRYQLQ